MLEVSAGSVATQMAVRAARAGLGLAWLFRPSVEEDLEAGTLTSILDRFAIETPGYFLYYPRANARIEVLRVFIDFMRE